MMLRPQFFGSNVETLQTNAFQRPFSESEIFESLKADFQSKVLEEFDGVVNLLRTEGVQVDVFEDRDSVRCPDAVFLNNWVSTHSDGTLVIYPMMAENRRRERREDIIRFIESLPGYKRTLDLRDFENQGMFLEGTGSLVIDEVSRKAYACLSARTHADLLKLWGRQMNYDVFVFEARDLHGHPIYHTNVMMSVGKNHVLVCLESISSQSQQKDLLKTIESTKKIPIVFSQHQMSEFALNTLELQDVEGHSFWVMSNRARAYLREEQRKLMGRVSSVAVSRIEEVGGGGIRCMLAELRF